MLSCSLSRGDIPGVQGLENRALSRSFFFPLLPEKGTGKALTRLSLFYVLKY